MAQHIVPANELAIKALQCPQGRARVVYHVDGHGNDGLKIYVESSGTKTWYYRARVAGSDSKDMALGRWPDLSITEARKRKSAIVVSISDGEDPWQKRAEERRRKPGITLNDAFAEWLETAADQKRSRDQDKLRYDMNIRGGHQFILGKWKGRTHKSGIGHLSIAEITRLDISTCLSDVRKRSPSQAHHALVPLDRPAVRHLSHAQRGVAAGNRHRERPSPGRVLETVHLVISTPLPLSATFDGRWLEAVYINDASSRDRRARRVR